MLFVDSLKHEVTVGLRLHCQRPLPDST